MNRSMRVSMWAVAALIAGCGGGGSAGSAPTPTPPPPPPPPPANAFAVNAAWRNLLSGSTTNNWTVTGTASDGSAYSFGLSSAPAPSQVFPLTGTLYSAGDITALVQIGSLGIHRTVNRSFYDPATFVVVGTQSTLDTNSPVCSVATASVAPPTSAAMAASGAAPTGGPLQSFNDMNSCVQASATKTGTSVTTWSLEADGAVNLFCLNTLSKDTADTTLQLESDCFEIAQDGTLGTRARVTLARPSVVAKNY
ncbi:MAG TPA: hypothetical protein VJ743_05345 [Albitalea sp.]|nr:hypothetical protein [Albitalea sp.]